MDDFLRTQWDSTSIRHSFIRKVKVSPLCSCQTVLWVFCSLCVIYKTHLRVLSRVRAGVPHSDSTACGHHFSRCRLHVCVSVPVKHSGCSMCTCVILSSVCVCAETQWGCLSSDTLASTGHLCKWIKSSELSFVYIKWIPIRITVFLSLVWCTLLFTAFLSAVKSHGRQRPLKQNITIITLF